MEKFLSVAEDSLTELQKEFDKYQKEFFPERTPEFFCLELNGEAGELANIEKKQWKGQEVDFDKFRDEAADVLIALMNYSNARGVDLGLAVKEKLSKIENKRAKLSKQGKSY